MTPEGGKPDGALSSAVAVRRSRFLVSFWQHDRRCLFNCATGECLEALSDVEAQVIDRLDRWRTARELCQELSAFPPEVVSGAVGTLLSRTMLQATNVASDRAERGLESWKRWHPAASFLHFSTKDVRYVSYLETTREVVTEDPYPEPLKRYPESRKVELPDTTANSPLREVLRERRTWRRFGDSPLRFEEVSSLLLLTWGVQKWVRLPSGYTMPLKTSPSGGARHSLEVYVLALEIEGLETGTYHYCPDTHALGRLECPDVRESVKRFFTQETFHSVPAIFVMTSVFERVIWRYHHGRAYRVVQIEAGHLGQTFCLLATEMGLAPFCTAAFADSAIERHLGIDGVSEAPLYVVGAGARPAGVTWAPYDWTPKTPELLDPAWASRSGGDNDQ